MLLHDPQGRAFHPALRRLIWYTVLKIWISLRQDIPRGEFLLPLWDNLPSVPDERHAVPRKCASVPRKRGAVSLAVWDSNHFCQDMCLTKIPHLTRLRRVHQSAHRPPRKPSTAVFVGRGRTNKTVCGLPSGRPNKVKFVLTRRGGI